MGKKSSNTTTSNTVAEPWSAAQPFLTDLLGDAAAGYGAGLFDPQPWGGIRVAPQSNMTQQSLQSIYDIGSAGNPITPQAQSAFGDIVGGDNIYAGLDQVKQNVLADVIPAVSSRFANSGMLDSSMAADTISRAAASAVAPIEYGAFDNAQNRRLSALGMAPQLAANSYLDAQMMNMGGSQLDQYNQALLDQTRGAYGEEVNRPYDELQRAASLALGFGGLGGSQSSTNSQGSGGSGALQTAGSVLGLGASLLPLFFSSDRRLKADIKRIGETAEGYPKYTFRYFWEPEGTEHVGVMADEVPEEITMETMDGYKAVDYSRVTL